MVHNMNDDTHHDSSSTSASTISTLNLNRHHTIQTKKKPSSSSASSVSTSPVSAIRRISWDNNCLENDDKRNRSHSRRRQTGLNSLNSNTNINNRNASHKTNMSIKSNNPQESLNGMHNEEDKKSTRAVIIGRELFIAFILITAGVFGSTFY